MNALRVSWLFFKLGVLNELQYRVNFFVALLQSALYCGAPAALESTRVAERVLGEIAAEGDS